jgi:hypothetical protein
MGNNQGNQKGTAQDQRERANDKHEVDSTDSKDTQRRQQPPLEKGDAGRRERGGIGPKQGSLNKKDS